MFLDTQRLLIASYLEAWMLRYGSRTGQFSSSNVIKSFSDNIYQPELAYGEMNGNFSGGDQSGAIGAIWSKPSEDQFVGAFALTRDD